MTQTTGNAKQIAQTIALMTYNIHSFMQFTVRLEQLKEDMGSHHWDIITFTETWREETNEVFTTENGHIWLGSGGTKGRNGVGILLHKRWKHIQFQAINDRIAAVVVDFAGALFQILVVYMPRPDMTICMWMLFLQFWASWS